MKADDNVDYLWARQQILTTLGDTFSLNNTSQLLQARQSQSIECKFYFYSVAGTFQTEGCAMLSHAPHESLYYACKRLFDEQNS